MKTKSRKFILSLMQWCALILVPIIYKKLEITDDTLTVVLTSTTALTGAYLGANVLAKQKDPND